MTRWIKLLTLLVAIAASIQPTAVATIAIRGRTLPPAAEGSIIVSSASDSEEAEYWNRVKSNSSPGSIHDVDNGDAEGDSFSHSDDDDSTASPPVVKLRIGSTVNTTDKVVSTYRNWVGPSVGKPTGDRGCYREAHIMKTCPFGFEHRLKMCWTECPLSNPIQCGVECLRQSDDCTSEIFTKFVPTANFALSLAVVNVFGEFKKWSKTVQRGVKCVRTMFATVRAIVMYIREMKVSDPQTPRDKLLLALYQTSYVTIDLPTSIAMCVGQSYPDALDDASILLGSTQIILEMILDHSTNIVEGWAGFKAFLTKANFTEAVNDLNETDISSLKSGMASNSSCGYELQRLTDRTWRTIAELKDQDPDISEADLRLTMGKSELMVNDIPTVTNNCMEQMIAESDLATAYKTRDTLRTTYGVIVNDLIRSGKSDNGTSLKAKEYTRKVFDKGFMTFAVVFFAFDVTRIANVFAEWIQPICGPTQLIGEIDDGTDPDTLGMKIIGKAFKGSTLSWTRVGDGVVSVKFVSTDTKDVTVNIMSGGDKYAEVDVSAGKTVIWNANVTDLGGRTLYLDRWRPGFLGLPGTGGGSLKLWVPRASEGGHLDLAVNVNVS